MILVVLGPLVICFLFNYLISRSAALLATLVAITTYSVYPLFVFLQGQWHDFEWQKLQGIYRFIGIIQTTGFNQSGEYAPSFIESLVRQSAQYGTTYTIIMLGFPATLFLLRRNIQYDRFCAVASSIAYIFFLYSVLFGTNEEHYYYLVILPAIICISGCSVRVLRMITLEESRRRLVHGFFVVSTASFVVSMSYLWYQRHFTPDNGCERLISYIMHNLPSGSRIFPSIDPVRVILEDYAEDYDYVLESSASNVEFVVVSTLQVRAGYGEIDHAAHAWLRDHAEPVFQFMGPTYGELLLYKLHDVDTSVQAPVSDQAAAVSTSTPATSEPSSLPPSMPGKALRTVLEEDFTNTQWQRLSNPLATAWLTEGAYRLFARQPGQFVAIGAPLTESLRDVVVTATFRKVGGPPGGGYGVIVRDQGPGPRDGLNQGGRYYVLAVGDRGEVGIWRREGDHWVDLVPWTRSEAVRPGSMVNELMVQAVGQRLIFLVNGTEVANLVASVLQGEGVGIFVGGDLNEVLLDQFIVQAPS